MCCTAIWRRRLRIGFSSARGQDSDIHKKSSSTPSSSWQEDLGLALENRDFVVAFVYVVVHIIFHFPSRFHSVLCGYFIVCETALKVGHVFTHLFCNLLQF